MIMADIDGIAKMAIGLTIALIIIAYVAPIGIESLYDEDYRGWGWKHDDGVAYQYNSTTPGWELYNTTGAVWEATSSREDTKTSTLMKLLPLFAVLVIVMAVILVVRDKMR